MRGGYSCLRGILADPPTHPPTHPPTRSNKIFPRGKNEISYRGQRMEGDFRSTTFFVASEPPPPPRIVLTAH